MVKFLYLIYNYEIQTREKNVHISMKLWGQDENKKYLKTEFHKAMLNK